MRGYTWLDEDLLIFGFDDNSEEEEDSDEDSENEESDDDEESEEDEDSEEESEEEDERDEELKELREAKAKLKATLRKERTARREAQKQLRAAGVKTGDSDKGGKGGKSKEESSEDPEAQRKLDAAEARSERLAERLATNAVDTAIIQIAGEAKMPKFADISDVLKLVDRDEIDYDQDEEDPSKVEVDKDAVREALQSLAKSKKHLLVQGNSKGGDKTGSKFGGGNKKRTTSKDALIKKYPALGGRRGA